MGSPYDQLPDTAFWRTGVAEQAPDVIAGLYEPKFPITPETRIMTAGSCFAQHIHRNLAERAWSVIDTETPAKALPARVLRQFGYGLYSARYGNIYTARQLLQLIKEAYGEFSPAEPVWDREGRFYDSQRPNIEPDGFASGDQVIEARTHHLAAVRQALGEADVFIFTLGLTETWLHRATGTVYPMAPGTLAGTYDPAHHGFYNFTLPEIMEDLDAIRESLHALNPDMKMLLTVSPVPLTATGVERHVLQSTTYSKSVLRAAAGGFCAGHADVDYFPSFDLITSPAAGDRFYAPNLRSVTEEGVSAAMSMFFVAQGAEDAVLFDQSAPQSDEDDDIICEEALIEAARR
ncbi:GSCFA domain-containing protein [Celeribacter arenosi]|uniref:GSCFA domain-containing protein n=2 Tax=Celeribacter arenosi TaxID=792649 RepID=A0ABP7K877_9RHOB